MKEAGLLHDIGLLSLERNPLRENGFSDEYSSEFKQHPVLGCKILSSFIDTAYLAKIVLYHHECWNGTGYPTGVRGNEIPMLSRIIAVAEMYYETIREHSSHENVMHKILASSGDCLDPEVVTVFAKIKRSK